MEVYLALLLNPTYSNPITEMLWKTFVGRWSISLLFSDLEDVIVNKVSYMFYVIKQWKFLNQMIESIVFRIPGKGGTDNQVPVWQVWQSRQALCLACGGLDWYSRSDRFLTRLDKAFWLATVVSIVRSA